MLTGIDIGGTKCAVLTGDGENIIERIAFPTTNVTDTLSAIYAAVEKVGCGDAIGVSCGGPLDSERGVILSPPNLPGWDNIAIVRELVQRFSVPVGLENDANACALAEWRFGAGRGSNNMIFLTFGTGMGAGLILDGRLYRGASGMAGEIGHVRMERFGPCGYGKAGSFEGFCSGGGIRQIGQMVAAERLQIGQTVGFCQSANDLDRITAKSIAEAAVAGDTDAIRVYEICGEKLGQGLSVLIDVLNPEKIVIGSIYERSGALLKTSMEAAIERESLAAARSVCRIVPAELGDSVGDFAAIAVAADALERSQEK